MTITINDQVKDVPFQLSQITLEQWIKYFDEHGYELSTRLEKVSTKDELERYIDNEALAWYSFWTGFNLFEVREEPFIGPVLKQFRLLRTLLDDVNDWTRNFTDIDFNNETWAVEDFKTHPATDCTYNELSILKEVVRQLHHLKNGRFSGLPFLLAVYLRKEGEAFDPVFVSANSERIKLLKTLPMNIVMPVAVFLKDAFQATSIQTEDLKIDFSIN